MRRRAQSSRTFSAICESPFYENTSDSAYASLFFAEYDDDTQRLRYANCGHLSGLIIGADNSCQRLDSTGTLLGLFEKWDCSIAEYQFRPGDMLVLYTDGITEACNEQGEEFGENSPAGEVAPLSRAIVRTRPAVDCK